MLEVVNAKHQTNNCLKNFQKEIVIKNFNKYHDLWELRNMKLN